MVLHFYTIADTDFHILMAISRLSVSTARRFQPLFTKKPRKKKENDVRLAPLITMVPSIGYLYTIIIFFDRIKNLDKEGV